MELKKKTIIGEDNNEPPKDYIGIKSDGKAYEFNYTDRKGEESKSVSVNGQGSSAELGYAASIVNMVAPASVPQPVGIFYIVEQDSAGYGVIEDLKKSVVAKTDEEYYAAQERWLIPDGTTILLQDNTALYPEGTQLQKGMVTSMVPMNNSFSVSFLTTTFGRSMMPISLNGKNYSYITSPDIGGGIL